jgi:glycyl-tRNA synthetase beta subunit
VLIQNNVLHDSNQEQTCTLLFELGVEEMPPSFQSSAHKELHLWLQEFLRSQAERFQGEATFLTQLQALRSEIELSARRISLFVQGAPKQEPNKLSVLWGPVERIAKNADQSLSPAGLGFCRKNGLDPQTVHFKSKADGTFLYAEKLVAGQDFGLLMASQFKHWCESLSAPLKMKWLPADLSLPFIRPVRWVVALNNDQIIPLSMFGLTADRLSYGQRIRHAQALSLPHACAYHTALIQGFVQAKREERRATILNSLHQLAQSVQGEVILDTALLEKCLGLFESPVAFMAQFDEGYLRLPRPLITSVIKEHMNYFSITKAHSPELQFPWMPVLPGKPENR